VVESKGLILKGEMIRNPNVSLSLILTKNKKVKHYIKINIINLLS